MKTPSTNPISVKGTMLFSAARRLKNKRYGLINGAGERVAKDGSTDKAPSWKTAKTLRHSPYRVVVMDRDTAETFICVNASKETSTLVRDQPATISDLLAQAHRQGGNVCVSFPLNDYVIAGHVRCCAPIKHCKPHTSKDGRVFVRFNRSLWEITEVKGDILKYAALDKPDYKHLRVSKLECWKHEDTGEVFETSTDKARDIADLIDPKKAGRDALLAKAAEMRRKAGVNNAYNPAHATRVKRMMLGRADALESKAYNL